MCGIAGFLTNQCESSELKSNAIKMADTVSHRGPDDSGVWVNAEAGIALAHRRLSIVDLSPAGHQPMQSGSSRYVIAFNGEIYNHNDLRTQLESLGAAPIWRGHSDTETLLAGFDVWGIQNTIERTVGMFAIAVWDKQENILTLVRDRIGEKPLYYGWQGNTFLFGSELKALKAHPAWCAEIDRSALSLFMRYNYVPAPYSIFKSISKLSPGCLLTVSLSQPKPEVNTYWSGAKIAEAGAQKSFTGSTNDAVDQLEDLIKDAVGRQMMADVPLGAFLSGGVDSSTVVALMQAQSSLPVKTFTIGFKEKGYNEAEHAKAVAAHIGTEHTELYITPEQSMNVIPLLPTLYDEPFSDPSQIPTFLISQLARQQVSVSLSGDAGDELFCGYNRYQISANLWGKLSLLPHPVRKLMAKSITGVSPKFWDSLGSLIPKNSYGMNIGDKLHKGAKVLSSQSMGELYQGLVSNWDNPASVVKAGYEPPTLLTEGASNLLVLDPIQRMMALDMMTYLPDDILVKIDRAAMAVSLETRVPLLDHRVIEFAWRLPQSMKLRNGQTKWILRQVLYRYVPKELIERPKMGFGVPIDEWLRGPLRDWAEALLHEKRLIYEGYFDSSIIQKKWNEHQSGQKNWASQLWSVLMFQAWLETQ